MTDETRFSLRAAGPDRAGDIAALALKLWPEHDAEELEREFVSLLSGTDAAVFLCEAAGAPVGFAQCQLRRDYVEGTSSSPVGYLEGIFVDGAFRGRGIARALLNACEDWARGKGCSEFASDCGLDNLTSQSFHEAAGFTEAGRIVVYVKPL